MRQLLMGIYTVPQQIREGPSASSRATFVLHIYSFIYIYLVLTFEISSVLWIFFNYYFYSFKSDLCFMKSSYGESLQRRMRCSTSQK